MVVLRVLGLPFRLARAVTKTTASLAARLWPVINLAAIVCNPLVTNRVPNLRSQVPQRLLKVLSIMSWPLMGLTSAGLGLRVLAPDVARSVRVWKHILPIFSAYMWTKYTTDVASHLFRWKSERVEARWAAQHERGGRDVYAMVNQVQGYYVKSGQVLATKREFVPAAWCDRLARLWDSTSARPWRNVRTSILKDLEATDLATQLRNQRDAKRKGHGSATATGTAGDDDELPETAEAHAAAAASGGGVLSGWWAGRSASSSLALPAGGGGAAAGGRSVAGSVSGLSAISWASAGTSWLTGGWGGGTSKAMANSPAQPALPAAAGSPMRSAGSGVAVTATSGVAVAPGGDALGGLFVVSQTAVAVMAQRAEQRPSTPLGKKGRRGGAGRGRKEAVVPRAPVNGAQGARLQQWFEFIDPVPLASASIAQVHAARLAPELLEVLGSSWTHGPEVVVKVQHADVQRLMGADLRNMGRIARFLNHVLPFDVGPAVSEMQVVIPKEFDFAREARLMAALRVRLARSSRALVVPEPVHALCGPGIIVMQRMQGTPLTSLLEAAQAGDAGAREAAKRCLAPVLEAYGQMMLVDGLMHCDPHPGNMLLQPDGRVVLLDFGQCKALGAAERRALCTLYASLATNDIKAALAAVAPFGLILGAGGAPASGGKAAAGEAAGAGAAGSSVGSSGNTSATSSMGGSSSASVSSAASSRSGKAEGAASDVDLRAAAKMLHIMFDTRYIPEYAYTFGGGDVVEGASLGAFPGPLYLVCRAMLILRGVCASLKADDVSVVSMWKRYTALGLKEKAAVAEARAAENAALDRGLSVTGL